MVEPQIQIDNPTDSDWKRFLRKHWAAFTAFTAAGASAIAGAVYVFTWFTSYAQSTSIVPSELSLWSLGTFVTFILNLLFWELVIIGVPVAIGAVGVWQWWKHIPDEGKRQYHLSTKGSKSSRAGGAISPLLFIAFAIKVYVDGNWNTAISTWKLDYVVGSMVTILLWTVAIFAIPAIIGIVWWLHHKSEKA
jgi:hypothetical protein